MAEIIRIDEARQRRAATPEPLWRDLLGERLRALRLEQGQKLTETAARAGISPQYLSEMERGRKDASSEMIAAVAGALGTSLTELARGIGQSGAGQSDVMLLAA
jgi:transcriptional regulator with XRE-family HTH domain